VGKKGAIESPQTETNFLKLKNVFGKNEPSNSVPGKMRNKETNEKTGPVIQA
jgi:hypothetical protein